MSVKDSESLTLSSLPPSAWICNEIWRRIKLEFSRELPQLRSKWRHILFGVSMQYVHGIFTQLAHRMHHPLEHPLHDVGFMLLPELGPNRHWVSEAVFGLMFASFFLWTFTPFVVPRKRFSTVLLWSRLLMVLVACQALRILSFSVTQVPGPTYHCRASQPTATRAWPEHWTGHLVVDVGRAASHSCGDLIFSSHTTFTLTGILAYTEYGTMFPVKVAAWLGGALLSLLIIASRKHYSVDVLIAWYTVPLVFWFLHAQWTGKVSSCWMLPQLLQPPCAGLSSDDDIELEQVIIGSSVVLQPSSNGEYPPRPMPPKGRNGSVGRLSALAGVMEQGGAVSGGTIQQLKVGASSVGLVPVVRSRHSSMSDMDSLASAVSREQATQRPTNGFADNEVSKPGAVQRLRAN